MFVIVLSNKLRSSRTKNNAFSAIMYFGQNPYNKIFVVVFDLGVVEQQLLCPWTTENQSAYAHIRA